MPPKPARSGKLAPARAKPLTPKTKVKAKPPASKTPVKTPAVKAPLATKVEAPSRQAQTLAEAILEALRVAGRNDAHSRVQIGKLLSKARAAIPHGGWAKWLESMPFKERSALNYIHLAEWAEARPGQFESIAPLGPSKLYTLVRLADPKLNKLLAKEVHLVPTTGAKLPLERLKFEHFLEVVGALDGIEPPIPAAQQAFESALSHTRAVSRAVAILVDHAPAVPKPPIKQLRTALTSVLAELDDHFPSG
jgi:hypothetical protein